MFEGTNFFIFTSFNTIPLILLVKIILISNYKSVKGDWFRWATFSWTKFPTYFNVNLFFFFRLCFRYFFNWHTAHKCSTKERVISCFIFLSGKRQGIWDWWFLLSSFEFFWEGKGLIKWQSGLDLFEKTVGSEQ